MTQEEKEKAARIRWRRKHMTVRKTTLEESRDDPEIVLEGKSFKELFQIARELTVFAYELGGNHDVRQPFQRNVARIIRPKR